MSQRTLRGSWSCRAPVAEPEDEKLDDGKAVVVVSSDEELVPSKKRRLLQPASAPKLTKDGFRKQTKGAAKRPGAHLRASDMRSSADAQSCSGSWLPAC